LRGAFLRGADLSGADLRGANLSRPSFELITELIELKGIVYFNRSTYETDLSNAKLRRALIAEAELNWCEPHFPDSTHSQLPTFRACSASNSTGGRYPRLECSLFWL
jgi:uncharacterized protein YjbI with pentapeptide repeats